MSIIAGCTLQSFQCSSMSQIRAETDPVCSITRRADGSRRLCTEQPLAPSSPRSVTGLEKLQSESGMPVCLILLVLPPAGQARATGLRVVPNMHNQALVNEPPRTKLS